MPFCATLMHDRTARLSPRQRSTFHTQLRGLDSALTHLIPFQVSGKLGPLGFLHVQLLRQLLWRRALLTVLGLLLWRLLGRSSHSLQRPVQHTQLRSREGQRLNTLWPWEHWGGRLEKGKGGEAWDLKNREKSSLIKLQKPEMVM